MRFRQLTLTATTLGFAAALSAPASAQFGNEWVTFARENTRLVSPAGVGVSDPEEKDYDWGDVNNDGWTDLVVVRKQPFTTSGRKTNVLFMNENGILVDRTSLYAIASDVAGDSGFNTPTNDRDVELSDVDMDGWLDIITATTLSAGQPKHISHPRVYMNLGEDANGDWLGFRYEDARFPQLTLGNGTDSWPRFCAVDSGDVTGDGFPDLYFADYDSGGSGGGDMNDRLLINDGFGFFSDESSTRMSSLMLDSNFGASAFIVDMNGDGVKDVVKDSGLTAFVRINYNNPSNEGFFNLTQSPYSGSPYFATVGDLNQDDRPDIVISDDGDDRILYNTGNNALGIVNFGPPRDFDFVTGGDDGFGGDSRIADLDNDGWPDIIITDVDVDISGCNRRTHIYHNPGGAVGQQFDFKEEAGLSGWRGVVGMSATDLRGTHDVAVFDIDNDGDLDMVFGLCGGTNIWMNQLNPDDGIGMAYCTSAVNTSGLPATLTADGSERVSDQNLTLMGLNQPANVPSLYFHGPMQTQQPFGDGFLCVAGGTVRMPPVEFADGSGSSTKVIDWGASYASAFLAGATVNFQVWFRDVAGFSGFNTSNGRSITFQP